MRQPKRELDYEWFQQNFAWMDTLRSDIGEPLVAIHRKHGVEVAAVHSPGLRDFLLAEFLRDNNRPPAGNSLRQFLASLSARAVRNPNMRPIRKRVCGDNSRISLSLDTPDAEFVEITAEGWSVPDHASEMLLRHRNSLPLPVPSRRLECGLRRRPTVRVFRITAR